MNKKAGQVGGTHYQRFSKIDIIELSMRLNLNFCASNIIKYVARAKGKNGRQDILKALNYVDHWRNNLYDTQEKLNLDCNAGEHYKNFVSQFCGTTEHEELMVFAAVISNNPNLDDIEETIRKVASREEMDLTNLQD